jgi:FKBP-type peptidyl-prolyl cis-trans isomerase 2
MEEEPAFYTHWNLNVFRYIATFYDEDRDSKPIITDGTTFDIKYTAYTFKSGAPTINDMFATNDPEKIEELYRGYDDENIWSTEPMRITLGRQALVSGLERALEGCREGDKVEVYLTFEAAYGKNYVGMVPSKTAVMWDIEILDVL